ncbi:MAG: gamma-glutamyl-gamma-aminobutyrate hydrolase family protein, partial [Candidatus Limnocylindrales bacterium]
VQHLAGHESPAYGSGPPELHPLRLAADSRLGAIVGSGDGGDGAFTVNTYHHQGVRLEDLAPGLRATGVSPWAQPGSPTGAPSQLVEALESVDPERFVVAVQCHPERIESTPPAFARLFGAFVEAARAP